MTKELLSSHLQSDPLIEYAMGYDCLRPIDILNMFYSIEI